ncbi:hypothetical protein XELAEV_18006254mg [Xenopus laevis]|uniref:Uncharacterized protein n=1 Tax=Xenopus laevis TaxID=8355 RepID=A0A974E0S6_XENLA|nr:hypothetical protein XELAEV_18006254mg [Xenopus laevis]
MGGSFGGGRDVTSRYHDITSNVPMGAHRSRAALDQNILLAIIKGVVHPFKSLPCSGTDLWKGHQDLGLGRQDFRGRHKA